MSSLGFNFPYPHHDPVKDSLFLSLVIMARKIFPQFCHITKYLHFLYFWSILKFSNDLILGNWAPFVNMYLEFYEFQNISFCCKSITPERLLVTVLKKVLTKRVIWVRSVAITTNNIAMVTCVAMVTNNIATTTHYIASVQGKLFSMIHTLVVEASFWFWGRDPVTVVTVNLRCWHILATVVEITN